METSDEAGALEIRLHNGATTVAGTSRSVALLAELLKALGYPMVEKFIP